MSQIYHDEESLKRMLCKGTADHVCPCASLAIVRKSGSPLLLAAGKSTYGTDAFTVTPADIFDLASLTKVIATTTFTMFLLDNGEIRLDRPITYWLPDFQSSPKCPAAWRQLPTPKHLLAHCSGLPACYPFHINCADETDMEKRARLVRQIPLVYMPGTKELYSDIGMIIMGQIIEKITGTPLDVMASKLIFQPLKMAHTAFNPKPTDDARFIPTELKRDNSGEAWTGVVHDENARWLGGVAGHAGLFSSAPDLARFARMMLNRGQLDGNVIISENTFRLFTHRVAMVKDSSRCLGWDALSEGCSGGTNLSPEAFGHTGFTGTSIWLDPPQNIAVILLTNAVHPDRKCKENGFFQWRNSINTAATAPES